MKKIFLLLGLIGSLFALLIACEDKDKDPWVIHESPENKGVFVRIQKETKVIDFTDSGAAYTFSLETPGNNVSTYNLSVFRTSAGIVSDTVPLIEVSSFPSTINITASDLASSLGLLPTELAAGDRFDFIGSATGKDGTIAKFDNLNGDSQGPGQFNAFSHNTFLSCPFNQSEAVGTYNLIQDEFAENVVDTFEVVPGPEENSITVVGLFEAGKSFDIIINPSTGEAVVFQQSVKSQVGPYSGGFINTNNTSFVFSCVGNITINVRWCVDLGCFGGSYNIAAQKQ